MQRAQDIAKFQHVPRQHAIPAARRDSHCCIVVNEEGLQPCSRVGQRHNLLIHSTGSCKLPAANHPFTASTLLRELQSSTKHRPLSSKSACANATSVRCRPLADQQLTWQPIATMLHGTLTHR